MTKVKRHAGTSGQSGSTSPPTMTGHGSHSSPQVGTPLYDRQLERARLDSALTQGPSQVLLILGPRNCGKTAILKSFLEGKRHAVYVDCRAMDSSNPTTFTSRLLRQLQPIAPVNVRKTLSELLRAFPSGFTVSTHGGLSWSLPQDQADAASARLDRVFETLECVTVPALMLRRSLQVRHALSTPTLPAAAGRSLLPGGRRLSSTLKRPSDQCWSLMRPMSSCHGLTRTQQHCADCYNFL